MNTRTFFLFAFCLSLALTACGRRLQNNQPTLPAPLPAPAVATEAGAPTGAPTALPEQPATEPPTASAPTPPPLPAATATPESDPAGDEVESLLQQLDDSNTAADQDVQSLSEP